MTLVYTLRSASSRRQSLATGHLNVPCFIWTSTVRMRPSSPGNVLTIRPRFHLPRGKLSSTTSTRSPIWASVWDLVLHFLRSVSAGTYSHNHLLQKWSVSVWACLHRFLEFKSLCHQWHREVRSGCSFQWGNSLHDRRFMSQAGRTWYFARSATRSWSARRGKRKIKGLFAVHCSCCSAHLRPQILTTRGDVKRTNQNTIHYRMKIVTFLARSVCIAVEMRSYDCSHGFANSYQSLWA